MSKSTEWCPECGTYVLEPAHREWHEEREARRIAKEDGMSANIVTGKAAIAALIEGKTLRTNEKPAAQVCYRLQGDFLLFRSRIYPSWGLCEAEWNDIVTGKYEVVE